MGQKGDLMHVHVVLCPQTILILYSAKREIFASLNCYNETHHKTHSSQFRGQQIPEMEPHDCSILYSELDDAVKRALQVDETLLRAICEKLKYCDEQGRTLPEFKEIKARFIWLVQENIA